MTARFTKFLLVLFAVILAALAVVSDDAQAAKKNARIIPPDATYRGKTYGEWGASWWQAAFALPVKDGSHPIINGGPFKGEEGVTFLAAVVGASATINVTIPAGTPLFVPIINAECSVFEPEPFHGEDEASLRACANGHIDHAAKPSAKLNGKKVKHLAKYRVESPLFQYGPLPENNLFAFFGLDAPEGTTSDAVDAGFYLLFAPLPVGQHNLRVRSGFQNGGAIDTTFIIKVLPIKCLHRDTAGAACPPEQ
jgi:hypothetical protein